MTIYFNCYEPAPGIDIDEIADRHDLSFEDGPDEFCGPDHKDWRDAKSEAARLNSDPHLSYRITVEGSPGGAREFNLLAAE